MRIFLLSLMFCSTAAYAQRPVIIPAKFMTVFKDKGLDKKYEIKEYMLGDQWESDFNGDKVEDIVITVVNKTTKKKELLFIHGKTNEYFVFGPGTKCEQWLNNANVQDGMGLASPKEYDESIIDPKSGKVTGNRIIKVKNHSITITEFEEGAYTVRGAIYWDGKKYSLIIQNE